LFEVACWTIVSDDMKVVVPAVIVGIRGMDHSRVHHAHLPFGSVGVPDRSKAAEVVAKVLHDERAIFGGHLVRKFGHEASLDTTASARFELERWQRMIEPRHAHGLLYQLAGVLCCD